LGAPAAAPSGEPASAASGAPRIEEETQPRWHPVIDFGRCNGCLDCVQFCVFKVLGVDDAGTLLVLRPDECYDVCAACARICPTGAIQLPRHCYPAIAGDPSAPREGMKNNPSPSPGATSPEELGRIELWRAKALGRRSRVDKLQGQDNSVGKAPTRPPHTRQEFSLDGPGTPAG
jgi:NAD-dependent dihydropyrimidine dehydrogenase PreA subunit